MARGAIAWATAAALLQSVTTNAEYIWPSKFDWLEDVYMLQSGYIRHGFIDAVNPCSFGTNEPGRQNAAEWIRTAYHDMATHDAEAGTGGVDASIMFELDRAENVGSAFNNTFGFMNNYYTIRSSMSDLLALAVIAASDMCNGPRIPFRAGRIDAVEAGPLGVPKPDEEINRHTQIFAKAGFNTSDMITMVACGHTLGGVHGPDFPEITGNSAEDNFMKFEGNASTSFSEFDNDVVTQYLNGTTENLLVVGKNETNNSDKRVFGADGNVTMHALADPAAFQAKCADILSRMIDTVPSTVTLSEIIQPIEIKPYIDTLALNSEGTVDFDGRVRVRTSTVTGRPFSGLKVHLTWLDRSGANRSEIITANQATFKGGSSSGLHREIFTWFEFATKLDPAVGIRGFNVHLFTPGVNTTEVFTNGGKGFPVDDAILYQESQSCVNITSNTQPAALTVVAAVRKDRVTEAVKLTLAEMIPRQGVATPALKEVESDFVSTGIERGGYVYYKAERPLDVASWSSNFDVVLGAGESQSVADFNSLNVLRSQDCKPI